MGFLDQKSVDQYWASQAAALALMLKFMDQRETWVADHPGMPLDRGLQSIDADFPWHEVPLDQLARIMAYTRSSRAMRMVQSMEHTAPEVLRKIADRADSTQDPEYHVFQSRMAMISRNAMLREVFSMERCRQLLECLEEVSDE